MKTLAHSILLLFLITLGSTGRTQQDFLLTSEGVRSFWYNPATVATYNHYSVNASSRMTFESGLSNPYTLSFGASNKFIHLFEKHPRSEVGIGLNYSKDKIGIMMIDLLSVAINYQFILNKSRLVFGIAPGLHHLKLDGIYFPPTPVPDPTLLQKTYKRTVADLGIGLNWFSERFTFGIASSHITAQFSKKSLYNLVPHYYANAMYRFKLIHGIYLKTLGTFRMEQSVYSGQAMAFIELPKHNISIGAGYRSSDALLFGASFRISKFYLGYFFDYVPKGPFMHSNCLIIGYHQSYLEELVHKNRTNYLFTAKTFSNVAFLSALTVNGR